MAEKLDLDFDADFQSLFTAADQANAVVNRLVKNTTAAGAAITGVGDAAVSAIEKMDRKIGIIVSQTSKTSQQRIVTRAERQADAANLGSLDPLQRARLNYERDLANIAPTNTKLIQRRTDAYEREAVGLRNTAAAAAKLAAEELALSNTQKRESIVANTTRRAATPIEALAIDKRSQLAQLTALGASRAELAAVEVAFRKLEVQALTSSKDIGARIAEFVTSPTYAARKSIGEFMQEWGKAGIITGSVLIALGVAAKQTFDLIRNAGRTAEEFANLGDRLGVTASEAALLSTQAHIAGVNVDSLGGLVRKLSTNLVDGGNEARQTVRSLEGLGVAVSEAGGKLRNPIAIIEDFSSKLNALPDHARQVDLLTRTFGRQAVEMLPLIKRFDELKRQALEAGIAPEQLVKQLNAVDDNLDILIAKWELMKLKVSGRIISGLDSVSNSIEKVRNSAENLFGSNALHLAEFALKVYAIGRAFQFLAGTSLVGGLAKSAVEAGLSITGNFIGPLSKGSTALALFGQAALVAAAAFAAFKIGEWARENIPGIKAFGDALGDLILKIPGVTSAMDYLAEKWQMMNLIKPSIDQEAQIKRITEALRAQGKVVEEQGTRPLAEYISYLVKLRGLDVFPATSANKLVDQFQAGVNSGLEGLERRLQNLVKEKELIDAQITKTKSPESAVETARISGLAAQSRNKAGAIEGVKDTIKALNELDGLLKSSQGGLASALERTNGAFDKQRILQAGITDDGIISYFNALAEATATYNRQLAENAKSLQLVGNDPRAKQLLTNLQKIREEAQKAASINLFSSLQKEIDESSKAVIKGLDEIANARITHEQKTQEEIARMQFETSSSRLQYEVTALEQVRDRELLLNSNVSAKTIQNRVETLLRAGEIEAAYFKNRSDLEEISIRATRDFEIDANNRTIAVELENAKRLAAEKQQIRLDELNSRLAFEKAILSPEDFAGRKAQYQTLFSDLDKIRAASEDAADRNASISRLKNDQLTALSEEKRRQLGLKTAFDIAEAQRSALVKSAEAIRDANTAIFDSFKRQSEGVLDAMFTRSQSVFQAIGNALKNIFLTAFKDIVSTQVAKQLTGLVTQDKVGLQQPAPGVGAIGKLAEALHLGARPVFASAQRRLDEASRIGTENKTGSGLLKIDSKLEASGHIGDLQLVPSGLGSAIPVKIANPDDIQQIINNTSNTANQTNRSSEVKQNFTVLPGGGGPGGFAPFYKIPMAAMLAAAMGLGQATAGQAVAGGGSAGPTGAGSAISTAIQFGGGERQDLGGLVKIFGSDTGGFTGQGPLYDTQLGSRNRLINILGGGSSGTSGGSYAMTPPFSEGGIGGLGGGGGFGIPGLDPSTSAAINRFPSLPGFKGGGFLSGLSSKLFGLGGGKALGGGVLSLGAGSMIPALGLGLGLAGVGGAYKLGQSGSLAGKIGAPFLGAAGGLLAFGSLTAMFPALLAAGPIGWIAAGAIGAAVGIYGALHKSKAQKMHDTIKSIYGVDISDKKYVQQLVQIADQGFGGNVEVAARSQQVREMVELYAQATGQNSKGIVDRAQASIFSNSRGALTQMPTYFNGEAVYPGSTSSSIGIPSLTGGGGGYVNSPMVGGANTVRGGTIQLDADATRALLQGQAASYVDGNPRAISQAASSGMDASAARRQIASSVLRPAFLTS